MKDSKGHGSDAHSSGVNQIGKPVPAKVLDIIRKNPEGFSVTLNGDQPKSGYMVALPGHSEILDANELHSERGPAVIQGYASTHAAALAEPGAHIGGWHDPDSGKVYLDVSHNIPGKFTAIQAGRDRNQKAIYDVKRARDIKTGGSGE